MYVTLLLFIFYNITSRYRFVNTCSKSVLVNVILISEHHLVYYCPRCIASCRHNLKSIVTKKKYRHKLSGEIVLRNSILSIPVFVRHPLTICLIQTLSMKASSSIMKITSLRFSTTFYLEFEHCPCVCLC